MARVEGSWTTLTLLVILQHITIVTGRSVSACFNNAQKSLDISCGPGYMLRITKAFYGYSSTNRCSFTPGDCTQAEHEAYPCTGQDRCSINLPSGQSGPIIPYCEQYSNYFQVEYTCEHVIETSDICRSSLITAQSGFISTPRYPNNYGNQLDCLTRISVDPSQKINLTIIDMDLQMNGTYGCHDWLYAFNQYRSVTLCGRRSNEKLTSLQSNEISIRFQTNHNETKKGFWIFFEAYPPLPTTRPTTQVKVTTPTQKTTPKTTTGAENSNTVTAKSKEKLPFVAIVAGVIGTLTFVLIVLLVLLVVKWWREKKQTSYKRDSKDVEYLDARNPAYRSSNGSEFQGIEIYYNC